MAFESIIQSMVEMQVFRFFFPWLLVLAVSYGVLEKYHFISEDEFVNGSISLAIAFMAGGGAYLFIPAGLLTNVVAATTFAIFAVIGLMIVLGVAGYDLEKLQENDRSMPLLLGAGIFSVALLSIIASFFDLSQFIPQIENWERFFEEFVMPILVLGLILGVVALTARSSSEE
ncbi:MAG: hypothetical protein ACI977_000056 [Candidatus Nanohaloarchaea archaeon]|jgi:peptidoglycan/LPS O-acetylase OafA/YrhL